MFDPDRSQNILGIIGCPIGHSLSPLMHNTAIKSLSLPYRYDAFEVKPENLKEAVEDIRTKKIRGINVTIPHKESVMEYLDDIDKEAGLIGAVNTISREDDRLIGYNTDGKGFIQSLRNDAGTEPRDKNIFIFGAGGSARGLAIQLALEKAGRIVIANRTLQRAELLVRDLREKTGLDESYSLPIDEGAVAEHLSDSDIIINTTSIGMKGEESFLVSFDLIKERHLVCDIVYHPLETPFLKEAAKRGAAVLNGLGMLIYQGDLSFQIWTGKRFPIGLVRGALIEKLS